MAPNRHQAKKALDLDGDGEVTWRDGWLASKWFLGLCAVIAVLILVMAGFGAYYHHRTVTVTIESKERVCSGSTNGSSDCKYLFFTSGGTFENTDSLVNDKFSSSDLYGRVKEGRRYRLTVYGWRLPFFSSYPNVVEAKLVPS